MRTDYVLSLIFLQASDLTGLFFQLVKNLPAEKISILVFLITGIMYLVGVTRRMEKRQIESEAILRQHYEEIIQGQQVREKAIREEYEKLLSVQKDMYHQIIEQCSKS